MLSKIENDISNIINIKNKIKMYKKNKKPVDKKENSSIISQFVNRGGGDEESFDCDTD
jgi:hypothetical protein